MGVLPATGTEISLGKIAKAYGIIGSYPPSAGANLELNTVAQDPEVVTPVPNDSETNMSEDFGGQITPEDYP